MPRVNRKITAYKTLFLPVPISHLPQEGHLDITLLGISFLHFGHSLVAAMMDSSALKASHYLRQGRRFENIFSGFRRLFNLLNYRVRRRSWLDLLACHL